MNNLRKELKIALLLVAVSNLTYYLLLEAFQLDALTDVVCFVRGACTGLGILFFLIGILPENSYQKFLAFQKKKRQALLRKN